MAKSHIQQGKSKFVGLLGIASIYYRLPKNIKGEVKKIWEDRIEWEIAKMCDLYNEQVCEMKVVK